jgi:hypothetical protein
MRAATTAIISDFKLSMAPLFCLQYSHYEYSHAHIHIGVAAHSWAGLAALAR